MGGAWLEPNRVLAQGEPIVELSSYSRSYARLSRRGIDPH